MTRLYSGNSYINEFKAEVTGVIPCKKGWEVLLSETAFYPESGGQPSDHGWINECPVVNVVDSGEGPIHIVSAGDLTAGEEVSCRIDWNRRFDHMQHHTGQHILSQAFLEVSGATTVSFHLGGDDVTIDLSVESLPEDKLLETENRANQAVTDNMEIKVYSVDSSQQKDIPVRKPSTRQGAVRIVEISGWDYSPCGGTHCRSTGEIGLIKITRLERVRQQLRVHFCCGSRALRDFQKKSWLADNLGNLMSCGENDLLANINKLMERSSRQAEEIKGLQERIFSLIAEKIKHNVQDINGWKTIIQLVEDVDLKDLNKLATKLLQEDTAEIVLLAAEKPRPGILFARINTERLPDLRSVLEATQGMFGGKGGGSPDRVQAGGTDPKGLLPALEKARTMLMQDTGK